MLTVPFTYVLYHVPTDMYYYGVKFAKGCNPSDLWTTYFTSSKAVKNLIEKYGKDSFTYHIRKTFNDRQSAINWEHKVLKKLLKKTNKQRDKWLNVMSAETFNITSEVMKEFWSRDSYRIKQKESQMHTWANEDLKRSHSERMKKVTSTDISRQKSSKATSKVWSDRDLSERKNITKPGTEQNALNSKKRRQEYDNNKKSCLICDGFLSYEKKNNSACSRKCAAILGHRKK